jgi:hypothetical protein
MKRHALLIVTVLTVALTGVMFLYAHGSPALARRPALPRHHSSAQLGDPENAPLDQAARRWLHGEPRHWRDCILQR